MLFTRTKATSASMRQHTSAYGAHADPSTTQLVYVYMYYIYIYIYIYVYMYYIFVYIYNIYVYMYYIYYIFIYICVLYLYTCIIYTHTHLLFRPLSAPRASKCRFSVTLCVVSGITKRMLYH